LTNSAILAEEFGLRSLHHWIDDPPQHSCDSRPLEATAKCAIPTEVRASNKGGFGINIAGYAINEQISESTLGLLDAHSLVMKKHFNEEWYDPYHSDIGPLPSSEENAAEATLGRC
jgi:hypothetical protein